MVQIATGLWFDYSKPSVLAPTLTLSVSAGYLAVSGLTLLVTLAGASFWNITAFLLHHWKTKETTTNVIDLQHRVILRNSTGALRTIVEILKVHQAWSKKPRQCLLLKTCTVAVPALLVAAGFAVAGLFTSAVANKTYGPVAARIQPSSCGYWSFDATTEGTASMTAKIVNDTIQARNYAASFYANSSSSPARPVFIRTTLPYTTTGSAPCPIPAAERCILGPNRAFRATSELLDSHNMFGINAPVRDRVQLQLSLTCSPVRAIDLAAVINGSESLTVHYFLGPVGDQSSYTYRYNSAMANNTGLGYSLASYHAVANDPTLTDTLGWRPIPDFARADADISVHFMNQNDLRYLGPVYDPWFSADGTLNYTFNGLFLTRPDYLVTIMACADEYRLCNPSTSQCTQTAGVWALTENALTKNVLNFNVDQLATAARIVVALADVNTGMTVSSLGPAALWANNKLIRGNISPALPDNQWQIEVVGWFQTELAKIQASITEFASNAAELNPYGTISLQGAQRLRAVEGSAMHLEAPPTNTNRKRKSTEAVPATNSVEEAATGKPAKRLKIIPTGSKEAKAALKTAAISLLDVSSIVNLNPDEPAPVYETCDTVRRKTRAMLAKNGVIQVDFLRAIATPAYGDNNTNKIQASSLYSFMKQKGRLAGNTSDVYYVAYVFFEKLRIKQGKSKLKDREIMEEIYPGGLDIKVQLGKSSHVVGVHLKERPGVAYTYS
ncbi:hypothetical protein MMYC01_206024 [Madurella mycetomatis]|uniref:DUF7726 domain-containing protein n=1 Tax=Madurella mycetomatis TaxID=100816 RepID=A0A175W543_9PEZI|nr:hypothetical protein MMYC01_206024 [Madurella mycetomatis]